MNRSTVLTTTPAPDPRLRAFEAAQAKVLARYAPQFGSRNLSLEGPLRRAHVLEGGRGAPLLLVHGGGGVAAMWAPILAPLAERYHVVAVDRPGCGLSETVDYRKVPDYRGHAVAFLDGVLDSLGWRSANVLANSMGGYWSLEHALANPERTERLVLAGAPGGVDRWIPPFLRLLAVPGLGPLLQRQVGTPQGIRRMFEAALVADVQRVDPELLDLAGAAFQVPGATEAWLTMLRRFLNLRGVRDSWYLRDRAARLAVPTLFLWGERDVFADPSSGEALAKGMPKAQLERIPGAGHLPWLDDPEAVVRGVRRWLG